MDQQITQFDVRVAHIGTEKGLAKEVKELTPGRMFTEEFAPLMPRASKGGVTHFDILGQRIKERWQQFAFVFYGRSFQLLAIELGVLATEFKYAMQGRQYGVVQLFFAANRHE
ncbi:hypothetical protein D3C80_1723030 [compost metagenome]